MMSLHNTRNKLCGTGGRLANFLYTKHLTIGGGEVIG